MNDLDEQITWLESTLNECSKKLSGDLFNDQIEIYDLAFSRAELLAAKVMRRKAASNPSIEAMSNFFKVKLKFDHICTFTDDKVTKTSVEKIITNAM